MKQGNLKVRTGGRLLRFSLLLGLTVMLSGCMVWNPWGYKKEWPIWKKTVFFIGPGHCPFCYTGRWRRH